MTTSVRTEPSPKIKLSFGDKLARALGFPTRVEELRQPVPVEGPTDSETAEPVWRELHGKVKEKLDTLQRASSPAHDRLSRRWSENETAAPSDYLAALRGLKEIDGDCDFEIDDNAKVMKQWVEDKKQVLAQYRDQVRRTFQLDFWIPIVNDDPQIKELVNGQMDRADLILEDCDNRQALEAASRLMLEALEAFQRYEKAKDRVADIRDWRAEIKRVLDYYGEDRPQDKKTWQGRFDALEKGWLKLAPTEAWKLYFGLKAEVTDNGKTWDTFRGRCMIQDDWKNGCNTQIYLAEDALSRLEKVIKSMPELGADGYQGSLRAELRVLKGSLASEQTEASMRELRNRLDRLKQTLESWASLSKAELGKPEEERSTEAKAFLADQAEGNEARKAYNKARDEVRQAHAALIKRHSEASTHEAVVANDDEYESIRKIINLAASTANANEKDSDRSDLESALAIIKRANDRLDLLLAGGPKVDRGKLGEIDNAYKAGLKAFRDACAKVLEAARAHVQEPQNAAYAPAVPMIEKLIEDTAGVFEQFDLSGEARRLAGTDPAQKQDRKRAREQVLQKVRAAMGRLTQSVGVDLLVRNPFGIAAVATAFHRHLRQIELEVLRGV